MRLMYAPTLRLSGLPETALWTLHNRACEAMRDGGVLDDPQAIRLYQTIPFDYDDRFGAPDTSHALRARIFDERVRPWLVEHPDGTVVELGCGLETQFQRVDNGVVEWLCVDVPEAIDARQRFLRASPRCRHVGTSVTDPSWMDHVDAQRPVLVTAQGLLMYLDEAEVGPVIAGIFQRFPEVELVFDVIPRWLSRRTARGLRASRRYRTPPMPWGMDARETRPTLERWIGSPLTISETPYGERRGLRGLVLRLAARTPLRGLWPRVVHARRRPAKGEAR